VLKGLFRNAARTLARRVSDPAPQPQRRRSGETGKVFVMAARAALRRGEKEPPSQRGDSSSETGQAFGPAARAILCRVVVQIPAEACEAATAYLSDTLDWLNLWEDNSVDDSSELDDGYDSQQNYPAPHL